MSNLNNVIPYGNYYIEDQNSYDDTELGYHQRKIAKGHLGQSSKIFEEFLELIDAEHQGASIMALMELSDMVGAIEAYLENHYPGMGLQDLITMSDITKRAFKSGARK